MEAPLQADSIEEGKYMRELDRVFEIEREWIDIDAQDIYNYDQDLYNKMVRYPLEVLAIFEIVLMDMASTRNPLFEKHIQARIFNLRTSICMRNLNPSGGYLPFSNKMFLKDRRMLIVLMKYCLEYSWFWIIFVDG